MINRLYNEFFPIFISKDHKVGDLKQFINDNLSLYPWITQDMINNGLRRIQKQYK